MTPQTRASVKHETTISGTGPMTVGILSAALAEVQDRPDARVNIVQRSEQRDGTYWTVTVTW